MNEPQITYRGLDHSTALDTRIAEHCRKLEVSHPKITRCHVVIDELDRHKSQGNVFEVRVDVHVPGHEMVAHGQHQDPYAAVNLAFEQMQRQLDETLAIQRGKVKRHGESHGNEAQP